MAKKRIEVQAGSGNVFADLGYADAKERRLKVELALAVNRALTHRGFTQAGLAVVCEGVAGLATPTLEQSVNEFFASRRAAFGGKTLEQCLERLRIAVAFGEREAAALSAYLSREPG